MIPRVYYKRKADHPASPARSVLSVPAKDASVGGGAVAGWEPIRTVVVDGSPANLKAFSSLLEQQSEIQLVGTATDGYHAVRRVIELEPDLVLTAGRLDGMNGLELARRIKALPQGPTVILITGEDSEECRATARAAGVDGFVSKQDMTLMLPASIRVLFSRATS